MRDRRQHHLTRQQRDSVFGVARAAAYNLGAGDLAGLHAVRAVAVVVDGMTLSEQPAGQRGSVHRTAAVAAAVERLEALGHDPAGECDCRSTVEAGEEDSRLSA